MTPKQARLAQWAITRQKGKRNFILLHGVLGWGLVTALLYSLMMWWLMDASLKQLLPLTLVLFPLGGVFWGWAVWTASERAFDKRKVD